MMPPVQTTLLLLQIYYKALKNAYGADYYFEGYLVMAKKLLASCRFAAEGSATRGRRSMTCNKRKDDLIIPEGRRITLG